MLPDRVKLQYDIAQTVTTSSYTVNNKILITNLLLYLSLIIFNEIV